MSAEDPIARQYRVPDNLQARIRLHSDYSTARRRWPQWVFDQLDLPPAARVLELGCGTGVLWQENAARLPPGWDILLTDYSAGMVTQARSNLRDAGDRFAFARAGAGDIPFGDAVFDAVIANHMLYHVPDLPRALGKIRRVLKPGGRLYAATNGATHMHEIYDMLPAELAGRPPAQVIGTFMLDNGRAVLAPFFDDITLRRHEDSLRVPAVEPLAAYILSRPSLPTGKLQLDAAAEQALHDRLTAERDRQGGAIHITKDAGLFIAA